MEFCWDLGSALNGLAQTMVREFTVGCYPWSGGHVTSIMALFGDETAGVFLVSWLRGGPAVGD